MGGLDGQMDAKKDGQEISHSTGLCPLLGPLPKKEEEKENQFPRGIIWSAVPLLRFILYSSCGWAVAGQQP